MVTNEQYLIATEVLYDDAHLWIEPCIDELQYEMSFTEKRQWIEARTNGFLIMPGNKYRTYQWQEEYYDEYNREMVLTGEVTTITELATLSAICIKHKLYGE